MNNYGTDRCPLCRKYPAYELRPHAVKGRGTIPLMCEDCFNTLLDANRLDHQRDRQVFGYAD